MSERDRELLRHVAERAGPRLVAGAWRERGGTLADLAAQLDCDESLAIRVGLCRAPRPDEDLDAWVRLLAEHFELDPARVRGVARRMGGATEKD